MQKNKPSKEVHDLIRQTARDCAMKVCLPTAIERDEKEMFGKNEIKKLAELGFMGMMVDEKNGGAGLDCMSYVIALEEICKVDASIGVCMSVNSLVCSILENFASDELKEKYLKDLAQGKKIGAFLLSEPEAGSDASAIRTSVERKGDYYIVNGVKNWITNGSSAEYYIVFAQTNPELKSHGINAFIIEKNTKGIQVGKKERKLGVRSSDTHSIAFQDVKIPVSNLLGKEKEGFKIAMANLEKGRIGIAAQSLGIAQGALDLAVKYCTIRKTFGKEIAKHQGVQFKIAEMYAKVESARQLVYKAATDYDEGKDILISSATAKLYASRMAVEVASDAVQIHGGYGCVKEYHVERMYRDAKITEIYEGSSEIQKLIIARKLLK